MRIRCTGTKRWTYDRLREFRDFYPSSLLKRETLDVEIEASFSTHNHRGRARRAHECFRLVAIRNEDHGQYHLYVTNVEHDDLIAEEVASVYRYRWEIELIFNELESGYRMDQLTSRRFPRGGRDILESCGLTSKRKAAYPFL